MKLLCIQFLHILGRDVYGKLVDKVAYGVLFPNSGLKIDFDLRYLLFLW